MTKPILCLDFDGVLHSYTSGWKGATVIPDPPVPGAMAFLVEAVEHFQVAVYSSRSNQLGGIYAMQEWLCGWLQEWASENPERWPSQEWRDKVLDAIQWPIVKPPAFVGIDDRVLTFTGKWPEMTELLAFKPWNKS